MNRSPRILIVEHDHAMRHGVCLHLELDGCACYAVPNVPSAIHRDDLGSFDLVVCGLTDGLFEALHIIEAVRDASGGIPTRFGTRLSAARAPPSQSASARR